MYKKISLRLFRRLLSLMDEMERQSVTCVKTANKGKKWQSVTFHFASNILFDSPRR